MFDAVGDVNKSVATDVLSSPARVIGWIDEVLDTLEIEHCAFVAASIGTWMATHYAMARPERVKQLAMLSPVGIVSSLRTGRILGPLPLPVGLWGPRLIVETSEPRRPDG